MHYQYVIIGSGPKGFGAWKGILSNGNNSLMQGVEWTNRVVLGVPELSLFFPDTANAMWGK